MSDVEFMSRAVRLANKGLGGTYPNPSVGAVVIAGGQVVGRGRSAPTGGPHAEVRALRRAGAAAKGATLYVTLEPCCHFGRTGPCTEAIRDAGITRVVVGILDPAMHANGQGIRRLQELGIQVDVGVLAEECNAVHEHYLHHLHLGRPFVTLKAAMSMDGRIATQAGDSRWVSSEPSRVEGHRLRAIHHAIAVGAGTVLADDPQLDVRHVEGVSPIPVVFDSGLRIAAEDHPRPKILRAGTLVLHTAKASAAARRRIDASGAESVLAAEDRHGHVDVRDALEVLGRRTIRSVLVEGGGRLLGSCVAASAWQRWYLFVAPKLVGDGVPVLSGVGWPSMAESPHVRWVKWEPVGDDLLFVLEPRGTSEDSTSVTGE